MSLRAILFIILLILFRIICKLKNVKTEMKAKADDKVFKFSNVLGINHHIIDDSFTPFLVTSSQVLGSLSVITIPLHEELEEHNIHCDNDGLAWLPKYLESAIDDYPVLSPGNPLLSLEDVHENEVKLHAKLIPVSPKTRKTFLTDQKTGT